MLHSTHPPTLGAPHGGAPCDAACDLDLLRNLALLRNLDLLRNLALLRNLDLLRNLALLRNLDLLRNLALLRNLDRLRDFRRLRDYLAEMVSCLYCRLLGGVG
jgi:hypothetical protein